MPKRKSTCQRIWGRFRFRFTMSKKGCSPDNSATEGFFDKLENEFFHHRNWSGMTIPEFCRMLDAYLRYYNEERPKEKMGWLSPMRYRRSLGLAA